MLELSKLEIVERAASGNDQVMVKGADRATTPDRSEGQVAGPGSIEMVVANRKTIPRIKEKGKA
jgi:hypothetical protein